MVCVCVPKGMVVSTIVVESEDLSLRLLHISCLSLDKHLTFPSLSFFDCKKGIKPLFSHNLKFHCDRRVEMFFNTVKCYINERYYYEQGIINF